VQVAFILFRFYAATVASCFEYLHNKNIIFRDLKPENLLISSDGYLKLTDFGFAKILNEGRTFTICGTPEYIAPEIILNQGHGKAADWWTLGILIYEMHTGIDPFSDDDTMSIYKNILKGKVQFPSCFDKEAKDAKSLIRHLLVADLSKRYGNLREGVNDIKKHRWFNNFSWEDLLKKKIKPAYIPQVKSLGDVSNFEEYPDSNSQVPEIKSTLDPFLSW
jgi:protein kinase A